MSKPETTGAEWLKTLIEEAEAACREQAKRDGIPAEWIEAVLAKIRGKKAGMA